MHCAVAANYLCPCIFPLHTVAGISDATVDERHNHKDHIIPFHRGGGGASEHGIKNNKKKQFETGPGGGGGILGFKRNSAMHFSLFLFFLTPRSRGGEKQKLQCTPSTYAPQRCSADPKKPNVIPGTHHEVLPSMHTKGIQLSQKTQKSNQVRTLKSFQVCTMKIIH